MYDSDGRVSGSELSGTNFSTGTMHQYDSLGRLIRDYASGPWWYYYDDSGNITRKWDMADRDISYEYTDSEWGDLLTKYDGTVISYGVLGNPLNWRNGMSFTWEHEKRLSEITQNGTQTASYTYDSAGLRSSKTVGGKTVTFEYVNNKLVYQTDGTNVWWFYYEADGTLTALEYNGEIYYYVHDGIGNIIGLVDKNGSVAARYRYDGWGNIEGIIGINGSFDDVSADPTHIANINPFRYKDYYYDTESEFYYLITRYYDPFVGRFLSADDSEIIDGGNDHILENNLFAYCFNNPVNLSDEIGNWPSWATKLAIGVGAIIVGAAVVAASVVTGGAAAFVGAAVVGLKAAAVSGAIGAAIGAGTRVVSHRVSTGGWNGAGKALIGGAVEGFANGFMTGGIMAGGSQILSIGFKAAANAGVPTGRNGGLTIGNKVRVLSPNHPQAREAGGTLLKIGSKYKNIRFDVGSNSLFHMNIQLSKAANYHLPIGKLCAGLWGGIARD